MAQVLPPFTTQTDPVALLQTGSSDYLKNTMSAPGQRQSRILEMPRSHFNTNGSAGYRGTAQAHAQAQTYASFKNRENVRSASNPAMSGTQPQSLDPRAAAARQRYPANPSVSTTSSTSSDPSSISQHHLFNKDDALLFTNFSVPPFTPEADGATDVKIASQDGYAQNSPSPIRPSPDRYQQPMNGTSSHSLPIRAQQSQDSIRTVGANGTAQTYSKPQIGATANDHQANGDQIDRQTSLGKQSPTSELPKRYRRRNNHSAEATPSPPQTPSVAPAMSAPGPIPISHTQDARSASRSASPTGYRPSSGSATTARPSPSPDAIRRMNTPSPLSRPTTAQNDGRPFSAASSTMSHSPAAAAMAAINEKETGNKSMKSRLRRAFSFGSAAELNRAGTTQESAAERAKARRQQFINELDEEQDAIAQKQEKSGLGRGIYGNRSKMFTGSTDNLSISSTASSASIMLRKMGNNVKKSGRSLKGLFRPKSVVGVPSIDNPMEASVGPVSMVNVEAEREQVNVNINPRDQPGGGTGYPKLERNSVDATSRMGQPLARLDTQTSSIAGTTFDGRSDLEEMGQFRSSSAPPLKKGILKRSYTASSTGSAAFITGDTGVGVTPLGFNPPSLARSSSPAPSTGSVASRRGLRRVDSSSNDVDDYFKGVPQFNESRSYRSLPGTPRETLRRNISFSPRIQFHDVWSATEYDRRGDVATCNRLTPLLAQQIKEELNTFKMEMEVHEASRVHTHFF